MPVAGHLFEKAAKHANGSQVGRYDAVVAWVAQISPAAPGRGSPEAGKKMYLESCQNCHGPAGKGDSEMAAYLSPPPADLTAKGTQTKTDAQLRKIILEGRTGTAMTGYAATLDEAQLAELITYIRSLKP